MTHGEILRAIGARVRNRREAQGLSRAQLAKKSSVSVPTISRLELSGLATISVLIKLMSALNAIETLEPILKSPQFTSMDEFLAIQLVAETV